MANDEIKFLPIFQILDIKNIWFLLELEMALATTIKKKFEPVWHVKGWVAVVFPFSEKPECKQKIVNKNLYSHYK